MSTTKTKVKQRAASLQKCIYSATYAYILFAASDSLCYDKVEICLKIKKLDNNAFAFNQ